MRFWPLSSQFFGHCATFSHGCRLECRLTCTCTALPKSKDSQQIPDVRREPQTMKMCVRRDEPATVIEILPKLRFEKQTRRTSFRWFQFRLPAYYGFQGPSTRSSSPCGDLIRSPPLQRVYAATHPMDLKQTCHSSGLHPFNFFPVIFWWKRPNNLNFPFVDLQNLVVAGNYNCPQFA